MGKQPGVMLYFDTCRPLKSLSLEDKGRIFDAVLDYGENGFLPDFHENPLLALAWSFLQSGIDRDRDQYVKKCQQNQEKALKSHRKRRQATASHSVPQQTAAEHGAQQQPTSISNANSNAISNAISNANSASTGESLSETLAPSKETASELFKRLLSEYRFSEELRGKLVEWLQYKTERRESYKETGLKTLLRQVDKSTKQYGDQEICDLIDLSMSGGWKGIAFDKLKSQGMRNSSSKKTAADDLNEFYNMAARWAEGSESA